MGKRENILYVFHIWVEQPFKLYVLFYSEAANGSLLMSTMRDLDSCHALSQVNCKCTWQLQISFRIRFTFLSNVGLVRQIVPLSCSLSSQTSLSLFFFYRPEKYLKSLCRPCSLQSAGDQEPRPQNVHHVDKLTQSASSRSISPSPL